jgi:hypothetical protein
VKRLENVELTPNWTSLIAALHGVLHATGDASSMTHVMGVTGHAFRIALTEREGVIAAEPPAAAVDFPRMLPLYRNAGRRFELIEADPASRDFARRRQDALKRVRRTIDRGRPAIAYDLHVPEFGIIFGYDDRAHTLYVRSLMSGQYGDLLAESRWPVPERAGRLIVLLAGERERVDPARALRDALRFAVEYAEHGDPGDPSGAHHGLAAFRRWREAFDQGHDIDPGGHALAIQIVQNARRDAARFLRDAVVTAPAAEQALVAAASAYDRVALALSRMATFFPYPSGGDVSGQGARIVAVAALQEAEEHEQAAVRLLASGVSAAG